MELKTKLELGKIESNFIEIKKQIENEVAKYQGIVYDVAIIKEAKTDKAKLNKLAKSINDERIKLEKQYNEPFVEFKSQVKQLVNIIKSTSNEIDKQVKDFEELEKQKKYKLIEELFSDELEKFDFDILLEKIFDDKWLNKSMHNKVISSAIQHHLMNIENDLKALRMLKSNNEEILFEEYFKDLNLITTMELNEILNKTIIDEPEEVIEIPLIKDDNLIEEHSIMIRCTNSQLEILERFLKVNKIDYFI